MLLLFIIINTAAATNTVVVGMVMMFSFFVSQEICFNIHYVLFVSLGCIIISISIILLSLATNKQTNKPPVPAFAVYSGCGTPSRHNASYTKAVVQNASKATDSIFTISCISAYIIFGSFFIKDFTLETFSRVTFLG